MNSFTLLFILMMAFLGLYFRLLSKSGSIAASLVGILTMLGLQWKGFILLGAFFATSSYWSKYKRDQKSKVEERHEKGSQRDWQQVLANGGAAAVASLFYYFYQDPVWILCFCIFIASSNSDTWASEIGTLSSKPPVSVRTLQVVQRGTSGAVSVLGSIAGLGGAFLIALLSYILFDLTWSLALIVFAFGFLGNLIDTFLGAAFQATYKCCHCGLETEKRTHCDSNTVKIRGYDVLNNDMVNFLSSFMAVLIGVVVYKWIL